MRFDPGRLQFMEPAEIGLAPGAAAVGLDIRVVGNDSGEKVGACLGCWRPFAPCFFVVCAATGLLPHWPLALMLQHGAPRSPGSLPSGVPAARVLSCPPPLPPTLQISILSGTLARLDRDAPHYSRKAGGGGAGSLPPWLRAAAGALRGWSRPGM